MGSVLDSEAFSRALFFPRRDRSRAPANALDRFVEVEPDVRLHVRSHAAPNARVALLFFHGNGEVVADYDDLAPMFARAGAALSVVDYRGYGESDGSPSLRHALDDAPAVVHALRQEISSVTPLVVMGRSLGGMCATELMLDTTGDIDAFVLESAPSDLEALVLRRGFDPATALTNDDLARFDPLPKIRRNTRPLLVMHGAEDTLIVPTEAERSFAASPSPDKSLSLLEGFGHNNTFLSPRFFADLGRFLARVTRV